MKICITSLKNNLDSGIDPRFGRAQFFLLVTEKGKLKKALSNPGLGARGGAGISAAQAIVDEGVEVLITGNVGPNAFRVLNVSNIKIFLASAGTVAKDAFETWKKGDLKEIKSPSVAGHFGMGGGRGMGGPKGRGGQGRTGRGRNR